MSAIENKKLIQEIYAAAGNPDPAARDRAVFTARLADDATWTVMGQYSWSRTFAGKDAILNDLLGHVRSLLVGRARTVAHRFIADGDHDRRALRQRLLPGVPARGWEDQGNQGILRFRPDRESLGEVSRATRPRRMIRHPG